MENFYLYYPRIFDTAPDADTSFFPRTAPYTAIAPTKEEAQREIVDQIFDPEFGICGTRLRPDDSKDRFNVCFDEPMIERPVEWDEEIGHWIFADEDRDLQIAAWKKSHSEKCG